MPDAAAVSRPARRWTRDFDAQTRFLAELARFPSRRGLPDPGAHRPRRHAVPHRHALVPAEGAPLPVHAAVARDRSNAIISAYRLIGALVEHTKRLNEEAGLHPWYAAVPDPIKFNHRVIRGGDRASSTPAWCEVGVGEIRGRVQDGKVARYQVALRVGFRVEA